MNTVTPAGAVVVAVTFVAVWLLSLRLRDASIVDPLWGPAFVLVALTAAIAGDGDAGRRWLLAGLTAAWGLRLGIHLTRRKLADPEEDRRYAQMRERRGAAFPLWSLLAVFGTQALLVLVVSLPLQAAAARGEALTAAVVPGVALWALGLAFEAIGDEQLRRFKADPANRGQVMDRGLWRSTRHPNYFGDACVWWGLWLVAFVAAPGALWWTAAGPVVMTVLLVRVSGKALLERDIANRRPGYAEYVRRTSGFVPLPPRGPSR
jgi:steroid 5-alpha reductase family enzyme